MEAQMATIRDLVQSLQQDTDVLVTNIAATAPLTDFTAQEEASISTLEKVAELIFKAEAEKLGALIAEAGSWKALELLIAKVFRETSKLKEESLSTLKAKAKEDSTAKALYLKVGKVLRQALLYLEIFGSIVSYLCFDSYRFEDLLNQVAGSKTFIKLLLALLLDYTKL